MSLYRTLLLILIMTQTDCTLSLYAVCTPSHTQLLKNFFLPSIQDNFDINIQYIAQECASATFMSNGWTQTTGKKVAFIIHAIKENMGDIFLFSDVDIQFFAPIEDEIKMLMQEHDMLFQKDDPLGTICTGFFACRANKKTLSFWTDILKTMQNNHEMSDQITAYSYLQQSPCIQNSYNIKWDYLPEGYFGGGTFSGRFWNPSKQLYIPNNPRMHHANWTHGIKNKIQQLTYVKNYLMAKNNHII